MIKAFGFVFSATDKTKAALSSIQSGFSNLLWVSRRTQQALDNTNVVVVQFGRGAESAGRSAFAAGGGFKNLSFQAADLAVVLGNGQDALQAIAQQGPQILSTFGTVGAMFGAVVAVVGTLGYVARKSGADLSVLAEAGGVLAPVFSGIAAAMSSAANVAIDAVNLIVNNLDRLVIAGTVAVALYGASWVRAFGMARLATVGFSGALNVLRAVMVRLPFVAIVMVATELIFRFMQLVEGAGGFAKALSLVADVGREAFDRLEQAGAAVGYALVQVAWQIRAAFLEAFAFIQGKAVALTQGLANILGPQFSGAIGLDTRLDAMSGGFKDAEKAAADAQAVADSFGRSAQMASQAAQAPLTSVNAIADALNSVKDVQVDVRDLFNGSGGIGEAVGAAGDKASEAANKFKDFAGKATIDFAASVRDVADNLTQPIGQGLMDLVQATKSPVDAFKSMATSIIAELYRILVVQKIVNAAATWLGGTGEGGDTGVLGNMLPTTTIVQNRASGGNVTAGQPYRVNENYGSGKGELFIPGQSGKISNTGGDGGQTVVINQNIYLSTGVQETVRREVAAAAPKIANASREAVYVARRRGKAV